MSTDTVPTVKVKLPILDESFTLLKNINAWALQRAMDEEDPSAATKLMLGLLVDDDKRRFDHAMRGVSNLSGDDIMEIFMAMFKAVSDDRPTKRSAGSSRTTAKKAASRPSVVR
jgi:hypothetical protein